jgi:hypothetical protein
VPLNHVRKEDIPLPAIPLRTLHPFAGRIFSSLYFSPASKSTHFVVMKCDGRLDDAEEQAVFDDDDLVLPLTW